jgi:hypothetical protein
MSMAMDEEIKRWTARREADVDPSLGNPIGCISPKISPSRLVSPSGSIRFLWEIGGPSRT